MHRDAALLRGLLTPRGLFAPPPSGRAAGFAPLIAASYDGGGGSTASASHPAATLGVLSVARPGLPTELLLCTETKQQLFTVGKAREYNCVQQDTHG